MPDFHIPNDPEWQWAYDAILYTTGGEFPEADPTALRAMGDELYAFTNTLLNGVASTSNLGNGLSAHLDGPAADAFNQFRGGIANNVPTAGNISWALGNAAYEFALDSESTQYNIVIAAFTQVVEIAFAIASGFGAAAVPALIKIGQEIVKTLIEFLRMRLQNQLLRLVWEGIEEGLEELWQGMAAQLTQMAEGNRKDFDYQDLALAFAGGFFIGMGVSGMHAIGGKLYPKINNNTYTRETLSALAETLFEGLFSMMVGGSFNPFATMSSSIIGGLAHQYAHDFGNQFGVDPNNLPNRPPPDPKKGSSRGNPPPTSVAGPPPPAYHDIGDSPPSYDQAGGSPPPHSETQGNPPPYNEVTGPSNAATGTPSSVGSSPVPGNPATNGSHTPQPADTERDGAPTPATAPAFVNRPDLSTVNALAPNGSVAPAPGTAPASAGAIRPGIAGVDQFGPSSVQVPAPTTGSAGSLAANPAATPAETPPATSPAEEIAPIATPAGTDATLPATAGGLPGFESTSPAVSALTDPTAPAPVVAETTAPVSTQAADPATSPVRDPAGQAPTVAIPVTAVPAVEVPRTGSPNAESPVVQAPTGQPSAFQPPTTQLSSPQTSGGSTPGAQGNNTPFSSASPPPQVANPVAPAPTMGKQDSAVPDPAVEPAVASGSGFTGQALDAQQTLVTSNTHHVSTTTTTTQPSLTSGIVQSPPSSDTALRNDSTRDTTTRTGSAGDSNPRSQADGPWNTSVQNDPAVTPAPTVEVAPATSSGNTAIVIDTPTDASTEPGAANGPTTRATPIGPAVVGMTPLPGTPQNGPTSTTLQGGSDATPRTERAAAPFPNSETTPPIAPVPADEPNQAQATTESADGLASGDAGSRANPGVEPALSNVAPVTQIPTVAGVPAATSVATRADTAPQAATPESHRQDHSSVVPLATVVRGEDGILRAAGKPLVVRSLTGDRPGIALLDDSDWNRISTRTLLPPDTYGAARDREGSPAIAVIVHGVGDVVHAPVRNPDGSTTTVALGPDGLAQVIGRPGEPIVLVSCETGALAGGFAHQLAHARDGDVLAPKTVINVGSTLTEGGLHTADNESWQLYAPHSLDDEGWDAVNDVATGNPPLFGINADPDPTAGPGSGIETGSASGQGIRSNDDIITVRHSTQPTTDGIRLGPKPAPTSNVARAAQPPSLPTIPEETEQDLDPPGPSAPSTVFRERERVPVSQPDSTASGEEAGHTGVDDHADQIAAAADGRDAAESSRAPVVATEGLAHVVADTLPSPVATYASEPGLLVQAGPQPVGESARAGATDIAGADQTSGQINPDGSPQNPDTPSDDTAPQPTPTPFKITTQHSARPAKAATTQAFPPASSNPKADPEYEFKVEGDAEAEPKVDSEPEPRAEADLHAESNAKADAKVKGDVKAEPEREDDAKTEAQLEPKSGSKAEVESEGGSTAEAGPKLEPKSGSKAEVESEAEPKSEAESNAKADAKVKGDVKAEPEPEREDDAKTEVQPEPKSGSKAEAEQKSDSGDGNSSTVLSPDKLRSSLPDYLRRSEALGPAAQFRSVTVDDDTNLIRELELLAPGISQSVLEELNRDVRDDFGRFLGEGYSYPVRIDGEAAELTVTARFDWGGLKSEKKAKEGPKAESKPDGSHSRSVKLDHYSHVDPKFFVSFIPSALVAGGISIPTTPKSTTSRTSKTSFKTITTVEVEDQIEVTVPAVIHASLRGPDGQPIDARPPEKRAFSHGPGKLTATGIVPLRVPTKLAVPEPGPDPLPARAPTALPKRFGVESVVVHSDPDRGTHFEQVAKILQEEGLGDIVRVGAPGRSVLKQFLSRDKLPVADATTAGADRAEEGWATSEPLLRTPAERNLWRRVVPGRGSALQARLVARQVRSLETADGVKYEDGFKLASENTDSKIADRPWEAMLTGGGGGVAGPLMYVVGPRVTVSRTGPSEQKVAATRVGRQKVKVKGSAVRYRTVYDLEVRLIGRPAQTLGGAVATVQWTTKDRARGTSLDSDQTEWQGRTGDRRTHFAPAPIEQGHSFGGAYVHDLDGGDQLRKSVIHALRDVPGARGNLELFGKIGDKSLPMTQRLVPALKKEAFVRQFGDPELAQGLTGTVQAILSRREDIEVQLSDRQLRFLLDRIVGPGLEIPLTMNGKLHDYTTVVTIKGQLSSLSDGEILSQKESGATENRAAKAEASASKEKSWTSSIGVDGRLIAVLGPAFPVGIVGPRVGYTASSGHDIGVKRRHESEIARAPDLKEDGGLADVPMREFAATLTVTTTFESSVRPNPSGLLLMPGRPGLHVPTVVSGVLPPTEHQLELRLLVPEHRVTLSPPPSAPAPEPVDKGWMTNPPVLSEISGGYPYKLDGSLVETFLGTAHLLEGVKETLTQATNDPIWGFADGSISTLISQSLAPDQLTGSHELFSAPLSLSQLTYGRRRADAYAEVKIRLRPRNPRVQAPTEFHTVKDILAGGSSSGAKQARSWGGSLSVTPVGVVRGPAGDPNEGRVTSSGVFVLAGTFLQFARGQKYEHNISGTSKLEVGSRPERRVLVQLDVDVEVVAETRRRGNLDVLEVLPDSPIQRAGLSFTLRDSLLMWMTERQARELEDDDKAYSGQLAEVERQTRHLPDSAVQADPHEHDRRDNATDRAQPSVPTSRTITLPAMIATPGKPSFGIGGLDRTLDLSSHIGAVRRAIASAIGGTHGTQVAQALLPESSLDAPHDNVRMLQTFLSHADSHITSALNGGQSLLLRLDGRSRGHTYQMTVTASLVSEPEFKGIVHVDKLTVSDKTKMTLTGVATRSHTKASATLMLRGRGMHVEGQSPEAQQHSDPGRVLGGAGAAVSANWGAREKEYTDAGTLKYSQSLAVEGPVATFGTDIALSITVTGRELPKAGVFLREVRPLTLHMSPYNSRIDGQVGVAADKGILPINALTDSARSEWRDIAGVKSLPEPSQYAVEHVFLDVAKLHDAAELALTNSGVTVDATTQAALRAAINTTNLRAGLPAMLAGRFPIPLPRQTKRELFLDARVVGRPKFAGANTDVAIKSSIKGERSLKVTHKSGSTYLVETRGLLAVGEDGTGGMPVERRHYATADSQRFDASATPEKYKTTAQPSSTPEDNTLVWGLSYSLEFSLVARRARVHRYPRNRLQPSARRTHQHRLNPPTSRKRAGVMLRIDDAVILRMNDAAAREHTDIVLPPELNKTAKGLAESSEKWTEAVNRRDGLRAQKAPDADLLKAAEEEATHAESKWWNAYQAHERQLDAMRLAAPHTDSARTTEDAIGTEEAQPATTTQETTDLTAAEPSSSKRVDQSSADASPSPAPSEEAQRSSAAGDTPAIEPGVSTPAQSLTDIAGDSRSTAADDGPAGSESAADSVAATPSVVKPSLLATPGDGRCQLYAVIGSDPGLVGERLAWADLDTPALRAWLADPELVRTQLTEQSSPERRDARELVPQSTELGQVAERLRQLVERHLNTLGPANTPTTALQAYRGNSNQTLHATVDALDHATVLNRLHAAGITSLRDPSLLPVAHLRDLYVHHRTADLAANGTDRASARTIAEQEVPLKPATDGTPARDLADGSLSAQQMFDFLNTRHDIPLRDLPEQVQRDQLTVHLLDPARPADPVEFAELTKAVQHWERHWHRDAGEAFIGLLASALGSRIRIHTPDHVQTIGPDNAPLVTIHREHDHYQATITPLPASTTTDTRRSPATSHSEPNGRTAPTATPSTTDGIPIASPRTGYASTAPELTSSTDPDRTESVAAVSSQPAGDGVEATDDSHPSIIGLSTASDTAATGQQPVVSPGDPRQAAPHPPADVDLSLSRTDGDRPDAAVARPDTVVGRPPLVPSEPGQTERDLATPRVANQDRHHVPADEAEAPDATPRDRPSPEEPAGERPADPETPDVGGQAATVSGTHTTPPPVIYVPAGLVLLDPEQADKSRVALNYPPQPGEYLVFAEGTPDGIVVGNKLVAPEHLAAVITADTRSHGKDIVLVACETGQRDYDLRLSEQPGITAVSASPDTAWVTNTGRIFAAATTYTPTGHPQLDVTRLGTWRRTTGQPPTTRTHDHYEYPTHRTTSTEPPNPTNAVPFGSSRNKSSNPSDKKRSKKSLFEEVDQAARKFTLSYGGGQYGRAVDRFRLRFARDKSTERAAQTLVHLSFKLHDVFRQLRHQSSDRNSLPKDLEIQGMLINGRLVFATNFNATVGLLASVRFSQDGDQGTPLQQLLRIAQSDGDRRHRLTPQDADEYVGRMQRSEQKIDEALRGVRDSDTARAMRANRGITVVDAAPGDNNGRLELNNLLTGQDNVGAVIVLRHAESGDESVHAEQKLLLAVHSAGLQPSDINGSHLIMGKYRPCLGCWAALHHHRATGFPVNFDNNHGSYYSESIHSLVSYLPHTIADPLGRVDNYLEGVVSGAASQMMSVSALSRQAPPADAVNNNGLEKVIPVHDAPNRGYVTASDSELEFDQEFNQTVSVKRTLDFTTGSRIRTFGTGKDKPYGPRAAQRVLNEDERSQLAAVWQGRDSEQIAALFKYHAARGVSLVEIAEASGAHNTWVGKIVNDKDGHEHRDNRKNVKRRVSSRSSRPDSAASSTTSRSAGKFNKRPDIDEHGRDFLREAMRDTDFYKDWKHIEKSASKATLKARGIPSALNAALAAARQQYSMQSIADYLHMPRKSLQQHLDKRYGSVNEAATKDTSITRQPSPIEEEMPDADPTYAATDSTYYDENLRRQMHIPPEPSEMAYEPTGAGQAGPSSAAASQLPQVTYSNAPITYDIPPQATPPADPAPPPANTVPIYNPDQGNPVYADNNGRQFYWNPNTRRWEYYDDNAWHGYRASDPHGKRKYTR
ncbi:hypothetical protein [Salinispora arenicola]|uniref:hypothetical protein n=1 Tax=Salinispora arenicola TaxID=168697 RepID=UPI00207940FE|nr:hypothetical protein [Salinispora arenicola]MCN0151741.1 hypothetical protein [Salinispora arenicola]